MLKVTLQNDASSLKCLLRDNQKSLAPEGSVLIPFTDLPGIFPIEMLQCDLAWDISTESEEVRTVKEERHRLQGKHFLYRYWRDTRCMKRCTFIKIK